MPTADTRTEKFLLKEQIEAVLPTTLETVAAQFPLLRGIQDAVKAAALKGVNTQISWEAMTGNLSDMRDMLDTAAGKSAGNVAKGIVTSLAQKLYEQAQKNATTTISEEHPIHILPNGKKVKTYKQQSSKEDPSIAA